jgi:phage repressor protein C with HTH and peptisase S24 domain
LYERTGVDPMFMMFFQQPDNSNYHRLRPGDIFLIDLSDTQLRDGERYLLQHKSGARVRRVFVNHDDSLTLSPDASAPTYRPETVIPGKVGTLAVVGRVGVCISFSG